MDNSVTVTFTVYQTYDLIVFYNSALYEISVFLNNNRMEENITKKSFNAKMSIGTWAGQNDFKEFLAEITSWVGLNYALRVAVQSQQFRFWLWLKYVFRIFGIFGSNMCSEYLGKEDGIIYKANVDESRSQSCFCASRFIKDLCFDLFSGDFMEHEYE